jgi:hypothetical protein
MCVSALISQVAGAVSFLSDRYFRRRFKLILLAFYSTAALSFFVFALCFPTPFSQDPIIDPAGRLALPVVAICIGGTLVCSAAPIFMEFAGTFPPNQFPFVASRCCCCCCWSDSGS